MATFGSGAVGFLMVDGYNVLGVTTTLSDTKEAILEETHALGDTAVRREAVGVSTASLTQEGFYDDATDSINDALAEQQGTSRIVVYNFEGNFVGADFVGWTGAVQSNYQRQGTRAELHKANASYMVNGQVDDGVILHANTQELADGNTHDGIDALQVWQVDDTPAGTAFVDETADFNSATITDTDPFPATEAVGDFMAVGMKAPFHGIEFTIGTLGIGGVVDWEYWNGTTWVTLSATDGTTSFTASPGTVSWAIPTAWVTRQMGTDSTPYYYARARVTTVYSTNPVIDQGQVKASNDNGASSANGGVGYVAGTVTNLGGGTSLDIDVTDSADDVTFGVLISFTGVTVTGVFAERLTVAGTVERYVAAQWAIAGGGAGDDYTFMVGFVRNP